MYKNKRITKMLCTLLALTLLISGSAFKVMAESKSAYPAAGEDANTHTDEMQETVVGQNAAVFLPDDSSVDSPVSANNLPAEYPENDSDLESDGQMSDSSSEDSDSADISISEIPAGDSSLADSQVTDISIPDSLVPAEDTKKEELTGNTHTDLEDGLYVIHSALNAKVCLGVQDNSRNKNANIELVSSNGGFAQAFYIKKVSEGVYNLINYNSSLALHIKGAGKTEGTNVLQYPSIKSNAQKWVIRDAEESGYITLSPTYADLALDCEGGKAAAGTNVLLNKPVNAKRQMWKLVPASGKVAAEARLVDALIGKGYYKIEMASHTSKVLDIREASTASGANVQIYKSNGTYAQAFQIAPLGNGLYKITNVRSKKCLATANGSGWSGNVVQKTENSSDLSQQWYILKDPEDDRIVLKPSNAYHGVLSTDSDHHDSGTNVSNANFSASEGQYWAITKTPVYFKNTNFKPAEGTYFIHASTSPKMIGVTSGSLLNSANVQLTSASESNAVKWRIYPNGDGTYTIQNVKSGKVLDAAGGSFTSGTNVQQYKSNNTNAQKWVFHYTGKTDGSFFIVPYDKSVVLDIEGARFITGSNIWLYTQNSTVAQRFLLKKATVTNQGWVTDKSGHRYFYVNNEAVTGWRKINGIYYYFRGSGILARNTVVSGYVIDSEGRSNRPINPQSAITGGKTIRSLLTNAVQPAGKVLYIWGGGWGGLGTSTANDSGKIGMLPSWTSFYNSHAKAGYDYTQYRWQYGMGLDCSGFVGWAVYNTIYTKDNEEDIVTSSSQVAANYIRRGWCYDSGNTFKPGDIVSRSGHVWISMGTCEDGSVLIMHSTPEGCQLSGTAGTAVELARKYMKMVSPNWPFNIHQNGAGYLAYVGKATWKVDGSGILTDPDGMQKMSAEEVCKIIFNA